MIQKREVPWYLWPFDALGRLIAWILGLGGRLLGAAISVVIMILGVLLSLTGVGACVGVPLFVFGFVLMLRSLF